MGVIARVQPGGRTELGRVNWLITQRDMSDGTFSRLGGYLSQQRLVEFCCLAAHYDEIAAVLATLRVPLDHPEGS